MQLAPDPGRRLALLMATSAYSDPDLRQLRAPGRDASDLANVLRDPRIGGFCPVAVEYRPDYLTCFGTGIIRR